jgi:hypothetical protein
MAQYTKNTATTLSSFVVVCREPRLSSLALLLLQDDDNDDDDDDDDDD